jgi:hypothetical protein
MRLNKKIETKGPEKKTIKILAGSNFPHILRPHQREVIMSSHEQTQAQPSFGYHKRMIAKGTLGEVSKIREELEELEDAVEQKAEIMALVELSDLYGAMEAYLQRHHPSLDMKDLAIMAAITQRAFQSGRRS